MTIRWGLMGAARIARSALAPAMRAAGHTLAAVAARDLGRAEAFAAEFDIPHAYAGYDALIEDPGLDAIYIALPNDLHLPWTLRALAAGKHVLCEKPLALNAPEVAKMWAAELVSGKRVMEAFCHIHHPQIARARALIGSGALGRLVAVHGSFGNPTPAAWDFRWSKAMGGGAMLDIGCYCLSAIRLLTGLEPVRVAATAAMRGDVDATLAATMELEQGTIAQFICSFEAVRGQHLTFMGSTGRLVMDWPYSGRGRAPQLVLNGEVEQFSDTNPYVPMVEHFAAVLAGQEMMFPLEASLAQARGHDALLEAAATGAWVKVAQSRR